MKLRVDPLERAHMFGRINCPVARSAVNPPLRRPVPFGSLRSQYANNRGAERRYEEILMNKVSGHRPKKIWLAITAFLVVPILSGTVSAASRDEAISVVDFDKLQWKDYPGLPGVTFTVVAGDPSQPGIYTIRAKFAPHTMSQPHWHPETRYVTVIKGTWWTGDGPKFDPASTVPVRVGGFATHAPKEIHYDGAKDDEVIVQISGIGPSGTIPVNLDGTDKK